MVRTLWNYQKSLFDEKETVSSEGIVKGKFLMNSSIRGRASYPSNLRSRAAINPIFVASVTAGLTLPSRGSDMGYVL